MLGGEETHPSLFDSWPCGCMHSPPPPPSSPALRRLDLLAHSCLLHREGALAQDLLDGRGLLRNCAVPSIPLCSGVPQFLRTHNSNTFLGFRNSMYSVIPGNSANSISWCRLLGCRPNEKAVNQMIVQEWLPTLPSITVLTS